MSEKKEIVKEDLDKVSGGDYGRQWTPPEFRQDYSPNSEPNKIAAPLDITNDKEK